MRQAYSVLLLTLLATFGVACHTMRFAIGDEPAATTVEERKSFFFWGLAPTRTIDVLDRCPEGAVAIRETTTLVDGLLELPTLGIYSPRSTTYYCRGRGVAGLSR